MYWEEQARCRQYDPDIFFAPRASSERRAKAICVRCPVQTECLAFALKIRTDFGIWGGVNARDRRKLLRGAPREGEWRLGYDDLPVTA